MIRAIVALTAFYTTLNELVRTAPDGVFDRELARIGTAFVPRDSVDSLRFHNGAFAGTTLHPRFPGYFKGFNPTSDL